jgi:hypothetical protein
VPPTRQASVRRYHRSGPSDVVEKISSTDWKRARTSGRMGRGLVDAVSEAMLVLLETSVQVEWKGRKVRTG